MSRIERPAAATGPLKKAAVTGPPATGPLGKKADPDAINISVDARVRLGKDNKPELVLEDLTVTGADVQAAAAVESNMAGRRAGVRQQITRAVVLQIAEQVAAAIVPVLAEKLEAALVAEHLPASLAADLAKQAVPEIARVVAAQIAQKVTITTSIK